MHAVTWFGSGDARFHTSNGGVHATFAGAPTRISVETTNGDVDVATDGRTAYATAVTTTNGAHDVENQQDRHSVNVLQVSTTNGDVRIK